MDSATLMALPTASYARTATICAAEMDTVVGATGHGAAPAVLGTGPHSSTNPNVNW